MHNIGKEREWARSSLVGGGVPQQNLSKDTMELCIKT